MPRMFVGFIFLWLVFYMGWVFLKLSSWSEKKVALKGLFVTLVLAVLVAVTVGVLVVLF